MVRVSLGEAAGLGLVVGREDVHSAAAIAESASEHELPSVFQAGEVGEMGVAVRRQGARVGHEFRKDDEVRNPSTTSRRSRTGGAPRRPC